MNIRELVNFYVGKGMTINQAENFACQQIVLNKIAKSPMVDQVLIKGGVLMFNMTHSLRRVTTDIDFDFIKYSISDESIKLFIGMLNKYDFDFKIKIIKQQPLHQEDRCEGGQCILASAVAILEIKPGTYHIGKCPVFLYPSLCFATCKRYDFPRLYNGNFSIIFW